MGLISRHIEAAGYATVQLTSARSITDLTFPPRAAFVDAPLGHTSGPPGDRDMQRRIVLDALELVETVDEPGTIVHLPYRWHDDAWRANPWSWSRSDPTASGAGDNRSPRDPTPQYQNEDDRRAAGVRSHQEQCRVCIGLE